MEHEGISVEQTEKGMKLTLDGILYQSIARKWEEGQFRPFYPLLKEFISALKNAYPDF
jgi:hypothetical protein